MTNMRLADIENPSLALCFSGGGLRATFFHLGVIKGLRETEIGGTPALSKVTEIYSVSGGSIFAAHLLINWDKYCGTDEEFEKAARDLYKVAKRDLRGRVIRRWVLSIITVFPIILGGRRTYWLAKEYEHLFGNLNLADFYKPEISPKRPLLHILTTSFLTGELCSFSPREFEITRRSGKEIQQVKTPADMLRLSYAVAASSAFPPLFPPVKLTSQMLGDPDADEFRNPIYLSDGGVFDNLGFEKFYFSKPGNRAGANAVLLSNAGGSFRADIKSSFSGVISRNVRASDIMMRRVAENTDERASQMPGIAVIDVRIGETVDDGVTPRTIQQRLRNVRTDLDQFSTTLVDMLVDHGLRVSRQALKGQGCEVSNSTRRQTEKMEFLDREAQAAAKRSLWLVNLRDWTTYILIAFLVSVIALAGKTVWSAWNAGKAEEDKRIAEKQRTEALEQRTEALEQRNRALEDEIAASEQYRIRVQELERENANMRKLSPIQVQLPQPSNKSDYRVWIQFAGDIKREEMIEFAKNIKSKWENTPGAERGGERTSNAAGVNEVRFGPESDEGAAKRLTEDVRATGLVKSMREPRRVPQIAPGSLEIWVSR
jgi:predicted acylesterase/phospholipase RssA